MIDLFIYIKTDHIKDSLQQLQSYFSAERSIECCSNIAISFCIIWAKTEAQTFAHNTKCIEHKKINRNQSFISWKGRK